MRGCFWGQGGDSAVKSRPCWLKYPARHHQYDMAVASRRVRLVTGDGKQGVWRTALPVESHCVLLVHLTPWGQSGSRSASLTWVSKWFLPHRGPKVPVWTLASARSAARPSQYCSAPYILSILFCYLWIRPSLPLVHCHRLALWH